MLGKWIIAAMVLFLVGGLCVTTALLVQSDNVHKAKVARIQRCAELEIGTPDECEFTLRSIGPDQFDTMIHENEAAKWQIGGPAK